MTRILVAGELNADLVMSGLPSLPILGREMVADDFQIVMGSSSAITAARLARLGANVDFVGIVGDDDLGAFVVQELSDFGVNTTNIGKVSQRTGVTIVLTYSDDRALLTFPGTIETYTGRNITREILSDYTHLHVGSFFLQRAIQPNLRNLFQVAHELSLTTSLDVGWDTREEWSNNPHIYPSLGHVDFFIPNEDEVSALIEDDQTPQQLVRYADGMLIMKRGKDGATVYDQQGEVLSVPSLKVSVRDTTGAGDAFNAGFLYAMKIEKMLLRDAMLFATACGAQAVTQVGGASNAPEANTIHDMVNTLSRG